LLCWFNILLPDKNQTPLCLHSKRLSGRHDGLANRSPAVTKVLTQSFCALKESRAAGDAVGI
jgi:hypothetical protein